VAARLIGDKAYDSNELRLWLEDHGTKPVIPNRSNRKQLFSFNKRLYKERRRIENAFGRLKDLRRIATRYDRLPAGFRKPEPGDAGALQGQTAATPGRIAQRNYRSHICSLVPSIQPHFSATPANSHLTDGLPTRRARCDAQHRPALR
jgi:hypothetical protein